MIFPIHEMYNKMVSNSEFKNLRLSTIKILENYKPFIVVEYIM